MISHFLLGVVLISGLEAHVLKLGSCPSVTPMQGFDLSAFLGKWYVIQKFSTSSSCLTYNYKLASDGHLQLEQSSEVALVKTLDVEHKNKVVGDLEIPNPVTPAKMVADFPINPFDADYVIIDTDYRNYALIFSCHRIFGLAARMSASILSRDETLDQQIVNKLRNKLDQYSINKHRFSIIDQSHCYEEDDDDTYTLEIDGQTLSPKNIASVIRKVGSAIGEGITTLGDYLGKGVEYLGDNNPAEIKAEVVPIPNNQHFNEMEDVEIFNP